MRDATAGCRPGNTSNVNADNQVLRNHWGIVINTPSADATANTIRGNTFGIDSEVTLTSFAQTVQIPCC